MREYEPEELELVKETFFALLDKVEAHDIDFLRERIVNGEISGGEYVNIYNEPEPCGCVYGTLALAKGFDVYYPIDTCIEVNRVLGTSLQGLGWYSYDPLERFAYEILPGDTPQDTIELEWLLRWIEEYRNK